MRKKNIVFLLLLAVMLSACSSQHEIPTENNSSNLQEELSYEEYFSLIRSFEMKSPVARDYNNDNYGAVAGRADIEIESAATVFQLISNKENPFSIDVSFEENRLYVVNYQDRKIESYFSNYRICIDNTSDFLPFFCKDNGVYAVTDKVQLVLLNYEGKLQKSIFTAPKGEIKDFYVLDDLAWVFCGETIFRIYLPTGTADKILDSIENNAFLCFLYPISNYEIEWLEYLPQPKKRPDMVRACYYNALTETRLTKDEATEESESSWPVFTGWWFVPEYAREDFEKLTFTCPVNTVVSYGYTRDISCGGGVKLYDSPKPGVAAKNGGNAVGGAAICYDLKPVFENGVFTTVTNLPIWVISGGFTVAKGKTGVILADGSYYGDYGDGIYPYRFAFFCENDNSPVYCIVLRADLYDIEVFNSIIDSVKIEKD